MEIRLELERLLAHDRWANGRALESLEAMPAPPDKGRELLAHLLGAEVCWIERMTAGRDPADWEAWERMDLRGVRKAWESTVPSRWSAFLADAALANPSREFSYVNYLGEPWKAVVGDVLVQLMLHSSYHRGQIATAVRAAGGEPAVQDWIRAVREGALPGVTRRRARSASSARRRRPTPARRPRGASAPRGRSGRRR